MKETGPATGRTSWASRRSAEGAAGAEVFGQQAAIVLIDDGGGRGTGISWFREHISPEQGTCDGMSCVAGEA